MDLAKAPLAASEELHRFFQQLLLLLLKKGIKILVTVQPISQMQFKNVGCLPLSSASSSSSGQQRPTQHEKTSTPPITMKIHVAVYHEPCSPTDSLLLSVGDQVGYNNCCLHGSLTNRLTPSYPSSLFLKDLDNE